VALYHVTAAQGDEFARIASEMTDKIRALGPSPVKGK
jgi:coenzyme F420-reducing hydrogenase delta subunit